MKSIFSYFKRKLKKNRPAYFIDSNESLKILDEELSKSELFGIDTEFDWRTTYFPKLSLIQISSEKSLFLIDCLEINPKKILKKYLEDKKILKIFHSVRSDTTVLSKCIQCKTRNVFDIQLADKFLTNGEIKSYGKIVKSYYGIKLKKTETNSNWLKRPLSEDQISYAYDDVDYLIDIYFSQKKKLLKKNLYNEILIKSLNEANLGNESLKKLRIEKKKKKFSNRFIKIFSWREDIAESKNVPPTYIFNDKKIRHLSNIKSDDIFLRKKIMQIIGDTQLTDDFISKFL